MCTLTWRIEPDGFDLFFNRDEVHSRGTALPPTVELEDGVSIAAPTDADAGGTWIAVNSSGLAVSLLNGYQPVDRVAAAPISRGLLVRALASADSCAEVARRIRGTRLEQYRSFLLMALEPGQLPLLISWDGAALGARGLTDADRPLVSAPPAPPGVVGAAANRRALFAQLEQERGPQSAAELEAFHRSHTPEAGSDSVCLHRDDARTVSLTHVRVSVDSARLSYFPGAPCDNASPETVRLRRATVAGGAGPG